VHLDAARAVAHDHPRAALEEMLVAIANHLENKPIPPPRSVEARLVTRMMARAPAAPAPARAPAPAPAPAPAHALLVADGGRWFSLEPSPRIDLTRRRSLRLLLSRLADERLSSPGRPLSIDALFAAGWPGERAQPAAAASRVYVAVRTLRRLGLAPLRTSGDGYLLDPDVPLRRA
jgi:hypothetical protein